MKSTKDVMIDALLNKLTVSATKNAAASAAGLEVSNAVESAIIIQLTTRALAFYTAFIPRWRMR